MSLGDVIIGVLAWALFFSVPAWLYLSQRDNERKTDRDFEQYRPKVSE